MAEQNEELLLTEEEQDNCVATEEQLEELMMMPSSLDEKDKRIIAKCILYGRNIAKAQLAKARPIIERQILSRNGIKQSIDSIIKRTEKQEMDRIIKYLDDNNVISVRKGESLNELGWLITVEKRQALKEEVNVEDS